MPPTDKPAPIYRYRVVVKNGDAKVERRAMRESWSRHDMKPTLVPIRDWTSYDWPEADTEQGAVDAAWAKATRNVELFARGVRDARDALARAEREHAARIAERAAILALSETADAP